MDFSVSIWDAKGGVLIRKLKSAVYREHHVCVIES